MKKKKNKHEGEIKFERVLPYDPPINWNGEWVGPFIRIISKEELQKLYPGVIID